MKTITLMLLFASTAFAANGPQWMPWPMVQPVTLYLNQADCKPTPCVSIYDSGGNLLDPEVTDLIGGVLVVNATKKAAKDATIAAAKAAAAQDSADLATLMTKIQTGNLSSTEQTTAMKLLLKKAPK